MYLQETITAPEVHRLETQQLFFQYSYFYYYQKNKETNTSTSKSLDTNKQKNPKTEAQYIYIFLHNLPQPSANYKKTPKYNLSWEFNNTFFPLVAKPKQLLLSHPWPR